MGWGRFLLLGNLGQQLDIQDREREMSDLRSRVDSQWSQDMNQDAQIETLHAEVRELKLYSASLLKLLGSKGIISQSEVAEMVRLVDDDPSSQSGRT